MKKVIALVMSGVMLSSVVLCGCTPKEDKDYDEGDPQTEDTAVQNDPDRPSIDLAKFNEIKELYNSKEPEGTRSVQIYDDSIRGEGSYFVYDGKMDFSYLSHDGGASFGLLIDTATQSTRVTFRIFYEDGFFEGSSLYNVPLDGFEAFVDDVVSGNTSSYQLFDANGVTADLETPKKDIPIIYSRLIKLSENAFPELGYGLEDLGIDLGSKYRSVDPTQTISTEVEIKNEHHFENGVCTDCGMVWTEYFYDCLAKMDNNSSDSGWHLVYGQESSSMISGDRIQMYSYGKDGITIYYDRTTYDDWNQNTCKVSVTDIGGKVMTSIRFGIDQGMYSVETGVVGYKYSYSLEIDANPGEFDKIFESKESFAANCKLYLFIKDSDNVGHNVWGVKSEEEIKALLSEAKGVTYYSEDEIINMFWEDGLRILECMDKSMVWMDTNLADAGINWKKKDEN